MINFKEFVYVLGIMCKGDFNQRLKLLYMLHQPPALCQDDDETSPTLSPHSDSTESALEAADFFEEQYEASSKEGDCKE